MLKNTSINKILIYILNVLIILQITYIIILNFTKSYEFLDYDSSLAIRHAIEMWKNGLFINNWNYFSTTEIDCVSFFAAPLYIFTNNLNFSMGIVHSIVIIIFILVIKDLFRNLNLNSIFSKIFIAFLFTIYSFGQLDYINMLFVSVGQYEFRILAMLVVLNCMVMNKNNTKKTYFFIFFSLILNIWVSLSSGNYLLLMILLPIVIIHLLMSIIGKKSLFNFETFFLLINIIVCIFSWTIKNHMGATSFQNNINIISAHKFFQNIFNCITGIFMLFGGLTLSENISIMSKDGIIQMLKFTLPIVCIFISIKGLLISKKQLLLDKKILLYAVSIILVNFVILCLTNTTYGSPIFEYRYHLVSCIMLFLCMSISLDIWLKKLSNKPLGLTIFIGITILLVSLNINAFTNYKNYANSDLTFEKELVKYAEKYDVDRVYITEHQTSAYIANVLDYNRIYSFTTYNKETENFIIDTSNFYQKYQDILPNTDKALLVATQNLFESLPIYIKTSFETVGFYMNKIIYISTAPKIDGFSGINPSKDISYDYPFSPNYNYDKGELNEKGVLITNTQEGFVLWGPYFPIISDINCDITLDYEIIQLGNDSAYFDVYIDTKTQIAAIDLKDSNQVTLKNVNFKKDTIAEFRVWQSEGSILKIKKITIVPSKLLD